jgi:hypothetical protein
MSQVPNPNIPTVPRSIIAEIAAEPRPTAAGGKSRAASHQKTKPSAAVTPVVLINEVAFASNIRLASSQRCKYTNLLFVPDKL